jgi:hypothetical protein
VAAGLGHKVVAGDRAPVACVPDDVRNEMVAVSVVLHVAVT